MATVHWKDEWRWLVGFVEPLTGEAYWWIVPRLNAEIFSRMLADFADHFQLGSHKHVVLLVDRVAFPTSKQVRLPEGVHLMLLSPQSPELQLAECLKL